MLRIFGSPRRYLQGPGALAELANLIPATGRIVVVADDQVQALLGEALNTALGVAAGRTVFARFGGECTAAEIGRLTALAGKADAAAIIGVGGGKAIDTAKGVARDLARPVLIVPTVASNDSPTSRLSIVYTEDHALAEVRLMSFNPDAVIVDTSIIVRAPARFFVSGIGDAISKRFEARACFETGGLNFYKGRPPFVALALADACYDQIRTWAPGALAALARGEADEAFERTVEASILLSGLAFENGGLSIAHSLTRGLSADPVLARALHGEQVAWGLLVQRLLEGAAAAELDDLFAFYGQVGLPRSLADLMARGQPAGSSEPLATMAQGRVGDAQRSGEDGLTGEALARLAQAIAEVTWDRAPYVRQLTSPVDAGRIEAAIVALEQRRT